MLLSVMYAWVTMTDSDGDGIYECTIPEGYPNVIFVRMDPGKPEHSWDSKWNQTYDLVIPSDVPQISGSRSVRHSISRSFSLCLCSQSRQRRIKRRLACLNVHGQNQGCGRTDGRSFRHNRGEVKREDQGGFFEARTRTPTNAPRRKRRRTTPWRLLP